MARHKLKCWTNSFDAIRDGRKRFEWRRDDRGFEVDDVLELKKYDPAGGYGGHSGAYVDYKSPSCTQLVRVTYILRGQFDVPAGYCVMSIEPIELAP